MPFPSPIVSFCLGMIIGWNSILSKELENFSTRTALLCLCLCFSLCLPVSLSLSLSLSLCSLSLSLSQHPFLLLCVSFYLTHFFCPLPSHIPHTASYLGLPSTGLSCFSPCAFSWKFPWVQCGICGKGEMKWGAWTHLFSRGKGDFLSLAFIFCLLSLSKW